MPNNIINMNIVSIEEGFRQESEQAELETLALEKIREFHRGRSFLTGCD